MSAILTADGLNDPRQSTGLMKPNTSNLAFGGSCRRLWCNFVTFTQKRWDIYTLIIVEDRKVLHQMKLVVFLSRASYQIRGTQLGNHVIRRLVECQPVRQPGWLTSAVRELSVHVAPAPGHNNRPHHHSQVNKTQLMLKYTIQLQP